MNLNAKGACMGQRAPAAALALVLAVVMAGVASAQTPYIAVYFDSAHSQIAANCPGQVLDTLYVVAVNFNAPITGAEFAIEYPPVLTWMGDQALPPVSIGSTAHGISIGFPSPRNGFIPVELCQTLVFWNCVHCALQYQGIVRAAPHPATGFLGVSDYPGYNLIPGVGPLSTICIYTPTEQTTWGQVKSLYDN
jgi:hypothetical protein